MYTKRGWGVHHHNDHVYYESDSFYANSPSLHDGKPQLVVEHLVGGVGRQVNTIEARVRPVPKQGCNEFRNKTLLKVRGLGNTHSTIIDCKALLMSFLYYKNGVPGKGLGIVEINFLVRCCP